MSTTARYTPEPSAQLELLRFAFGRDGAVTVHVKSPGQMFGLTLEQALRRIDEFSQQDQAWILARLPAYYDIPGAADWRHEGPLFLLHHSLGVDEFGGVAVRSHVGRCGITLEEALQRLDQFNAADQVELLAGLAKHFDLAQVSAKRQVTHEYE